MLDALRRFFDEEVASGAADGADDTLRLRKATCALLLEIAWADDDFGPEERHVVETLVRERFGLDGPAAAELMALAEKERARSTDYYQFTRLMREELSREERLDILRMLWTVVYSDGVLEAHEDALVHKLTRLLGLKHQETIAMKLRARDSASRD